MQAKLKSSEELEVEKITQEKKSLQKHRLKQEKLYRKIVKEQGQQASQEKHQSGKKSSYV